jgi:transposase
VLEHIKKRVKTRRYRKRVKTKKKRVKIPTEKNKKKKIGKPVGGKGGGRKRPTRIEREVSVVLEACPNCRESFAGRRPHDSYDRCVTDMVFLDNGLVVENTKYIIHGYKCKTCQKVRFPRIDSAPKGGRFGYGMITYVLMNRGELHLSYDTIVHMLKVFFHISISKTTLIDWMINSIRPLEKIYKQLWKKALKSGYLHVDETGLPMNGAQWWMWVFVTKRIVLYHAHRSRGHDAIKDELEAFHGIIISDFWGAYNKLDQEQQKCWAHLIRELEEVIHEKLTEKEKLVQKLQLDEERKQSLEQGETSPQRKRGRKKQFPPPLTPSELKKVKKRIAQLNDIIWQFLTLLDFFTALLHRYNEVQKTKAAQDTTIPPPLPSPQEAENQLELLIFLLEKQGVQDPDLARILKRLKKFKVFLFTFLKYEEVPPTNNPAEHEVRPFVIQRNCSGSFKSEESANAHAMHFSLRGTCKLNDIDYKSALNSCLREKWEEVLVQISI